MSSLATNLTNAEPLSSASEKIGNSNALTHGGTSERLILPEENREDFEALLKSLQSEYQPETTQQHLFIEQLAMGHWFLWRRQRTYNAIEAGVYALESQATSWTDDTFHRLALAERYKTSAERALKRALQNAESIRKVRLSDQARIESHHRWRAEQDLREARHKSEQEKRQAALSAAQAKAAVKAASDEPQHKVIDWPEYPDVVPGVPISPIPRKRPAQPSLSEEAHS